MNLFEYKELIDGKPMHIATVNSENNPNLAVASDVWVIEENKLIISVNEMVKWVLFGATKPKGAIVVTITNISKYE